MKILIAIWDANGSYSAHYDGTKDPPIVTAGEDDIKVDEQIIFEAIDLIKKAVKED